VIGGGGGGGGGGGEPAPPDEPPQAASARTPVRAAKILLLPAMPGVRPLLINWLIILRIWCGAAAFQLTVSAIRAERTLKPVIISSVQGK